MFEGFVLSAFARTLLPYGAALLLAFVAFKSVENRGVNKTIAKVETQNESVRKRAGDAGRKSGDPDARGVLDPYRTK